MKSLLAAFCMGIGFAASAGAQEHPDYQTMPLEQIKAEAASLHPAALYVLASRLLAEGSEQEAANWMYAGQLRYRFMISALGEAVNDERVLFLALTEQVGRPVNENIARDVDGWIAAMEWALAWDAANDNAMTSKADHAALLQEVRQGLEGLIAQVNSSRDQIREQRSASGLENR